MTYQLTCKVCNQAFTRKTKPRTDRLKFGPVCLRKECRAELGRRVLQSKSNRTHCQRGHEYTPENTLIRSGGDRQCRTCKRDSERRLRKANGTTTPEPSTSPFAICQNCQHIRARADMQGDRCKFCPGSVPRLGAQPLPAGFAVRKYPEPPGDALELQLRRMGVR